MRSYKQSFVRRILIARPYEFSPLQVRLRAYAEFSDWLDAELEKLEARWSPAAALRKAAGGRRKREK
jgi:hypothetical protein